jgi:hypothetical protein
MEKIWERTLEQYGAFFKTKWLNDIGLKGLGIQVNLTIVHAMHTETDEHIKQWPQTDYDYMILTKGEEANEKKFYAWVALLPVT